MGFRSTIAKLIAPKEAAAASDSASAELVAPQSATIGHNGGPALDAAPQNATPLPMITADSQAWLEMFGPAGKLPGPTEASALTVSSIYACINLIAGAISGLPLVVYRVDVSTGERDQIHDDPLVWVFNEQMAPRWAAAAGWEFLILSLLLLGDAFAVIQRAGIDGRPVGLMPIHPRRVTVLPNLDGSRLIYLVEPEFQGGQAVVYDQDDILHVPGFGFDGIRGLSPLRYALRMAAPAAIAMQEFAANFFANAGRPDYALQTKEALGSEAIEQLRSQIAEKHAGSANAHRPMLLHAGLEFKPITMPLEEMQLVLARQFQIEEVARIYGVPPFMVGHNEKTTSWGSGVGEMGQGFVRYTLRQHTIKIENEINRKIFRTASRVAEFDPSELERADTKSFFEAMRVALGRAGERQFMTINEVRKKLRLKRDTAAESDKLGLNPITAKSGAADNAGNAAA